MKKNYKAFKLLQEATQMFFESRFQDAIRLSQEALQLYRDSNDYQGVGVATETLAGIYYHISAYRESIKYGRYSLKVSCHAGDIEGMSRSHQVMAGSYHGMGNYNRALRHSEKSLKLARELKNAQLEVSAYGNIAHVLAVQGRYVDAVAYLQEVSDKLSSGEHLYKDLFYSRLQNLLGSIYRGVGENDLADEAFDKALANAKAMKEPLGISQALVNISIGFIMKKKYQEAINFLGNGLDIKNKVGDLKGESLIHNNLGQCYEKLGRDEEALASFYSALDISSRIGFKEGVWQALSNIGTIHSKIGQYAQAKGFLREALKLVDTSAQSTDKATILLEIAHVFILTEEYSEAEKYLRETISISETLRSNLKTEESFKISIFERQIGAYYGLQWVLAQQGKYEAALEVAERGRGRALVENLEQRLNEHQSGSAFIKSPNLNKIRQIITEQDTTCVVYSIIVNPQDRFQYTDENQRKELFIWVIAKDQKEEIKFYRTLLPAIEDVPEEPRLAPDVATGKLNREAQILNGQAEDFPEKEELAGLHEILIEPISDYLPRDPDELVTFIPDQILLLIPFAALVDRSDKYLIESHTISFSPSIQTLQMTRQQRERIELENKSGAVVVGNPDMPSITLALGKPPVKLIPLEQAEKEALEIAKLLGTTALVGRKATKRAILSLMTQKRFIHLATHGIFDDLNNSKEPGSIALAPEGQDNGVLTGSEIARLDLHAELTVLSACNTGQGRMTAEGAIGLSRAFMVAGTSSIIVSLTAIADGPTAFLMMSFYHHYREASKERHKFIKAKALRCAMLETMARNPDPVDWASFLLLGDPR